MNYKLLTIGAVAAAALLTTAQANTISGSLWLVPEATSQNAVLASLTGLSANGDISFTLSSGALTFSQGALSPYTETAWLTSGGAGSIVEHTAGTLANIMDNSPTPGTQGTLMRLTGTISVTHNEVFTLTHDDGVTLIVNGQTLAGFTSGPTSPSTQTGTYTGAAGDVAFTLIYGENSGPPAQLTGNLGPLAPQAVPDGGTTVALLGMGLAGLAGLGRRVRAS
jgi:hypothetical protein